MKKQRSKTINVDLWTWQELAKLKVEVDFKDMDAVIRHLLSLRPRDVK